MELANRPFAPLLLQFKLFSYNVLNLLREGLTAVTKQRCLTDKVEDMAATPYLACIAVESML